MNIQIIRATDLTEQQWAAWSALQKSEPSLANPFFRPEFTQAVAEERDDVEVAIWEQDGQPIGFWPWERSHRRIAFPVGAYINQFQGAITRPDSAWSPNEVMRAAGLADWRFDNLHATQAQFTRFQYVVKGSAYLDLSEGFDHYRRGRGKSAKTQIDHIMQKDRKAGRDIGEVTLQASKSDEDLKQLISWKIDQCHRTGVPCAFDLDWVVRLHHRLLACGTEDFSGELFSLRVGDRLAGALFCLRSRGTLQGSILGFDRDLGQFAPGLVTLVRVAQLAESLGIRRIELGAGGDSYKEKMASGFENVAEGAVSVQLLSPLYRGFFRVKDHLRSTRLRGPVRRMRAWVHSTRIKLGHRI